jgi:endonuclease YncB( thermonuclease family)
MHRIALPACLLLASPALAADTIPGPVEARVLRVIDGDSFVAEAHVWPGHVVNVSVRIRGIDAPEIRSRCAAEREAAETARAALEAMIASGPVTMTRIGGGKYYGRVLADVTAHDGRRVANAMIARAHAQPYAGGRRIAFCR